jgi:hypothetical protein
MKGTCWKVSFELMSYQEYILAESACLVSTKSMTVEVVLSVCEIFNVEYLCTGYLLFFWRHYDG